MGPKYSQAYADVCRLRKAIERTLGRKHGQLTLIQGARVQSLCRLELNCRIAEQTIRDTPAMPSKELASTRSLIAQWTCQRDKMLAELLGNGKGTAASDPAALYAMPANEQEEQDDPQAVQGQDDATEIPGDEIEPPPASMEVSFGRGRRITPL